MHSLTAGSNFTLQWSHSGHTSVLLYMPCRVAAQLCISVCAHQANILQHRRHSTTRYLKMVHNDRVIVLAIIVPGLFRPLLIWLPCVISVLHAQTCNQ